MTAFLLGFMSGAFLCACLALAYYLRARARVRSIQAAITRYRQASQVVTQACDRTFGKS